MMKCTVSVASRAALAACVVAGLAACGDDPDTKSDAEFEAEIVAGMQASIGEDLADLVKAAQDLQAAAPTTAWDATADAAAITAMREAWKRTRIAYEHVEGATAPIFGDLDFAMDARYNDQLEEGPDDDLFDDEGITGMHAIERILYAPTIRDEVIEFEAPLTGYKAAAFPESDAEAMAFKMVLVQKLIDDAIELRDSWQPAAIDIEAAFAGLIGLMNEQQEKVDLAATGEEESRYANITMFDLRNNLEGTEQIYVLFRAWIQSKDGGDEHDAAITARFGTLRTLYAATAGDAIPAVPEDWSSDAPTPAQLATPFGTLWQAVQDAVDPDAEGSMVFEMSEAAVLLGFPAFEE